MVESLGFLLRNSIHMEKDTVTIQEEADIVLHYMTIQRFRFEERLNFTLDIDEEVKHCLIPKLTLQPLAENAIQYALEPFTRPCAIRLQAKRRRIVSVLRSKITAPAWMSGSSKHRAEEESDSGISVNGSG